MSRAGALSLVMTLTLALTASGCGGGNDVSGNEQFAPRFEPPAGAKYGGSLRVLLSSDIGPLDPGQAISQSSSMAVSAMQRGPMRISDGSVPEPVPDLAAARPSVDVEHGLMRVKLRTGVRFSPPVNRRVRADDVKYGIERALMPGVANGEVATFLGSLVGFHRAKRMAKLHPRRAPAIRGISTPSQNQILFRFKGKVPPLAESALTLGFAAPVPREYARPFDRFIPSRYGEHVVSSGPYMVGRDSSGDLTGYKPGVSITLMRNPNWRAESDYRPAFLDRIDIQSGFTNVQSASDAILDGSAMVNGDFAPTPIALKRAATEYPAQLTIVPSSATIYSSLNTTVRPFDDVNVRRAVLAATDRNAMRLAVGGRLAGHLATHFLPPVVSGFEEAGGLAGPGFDFLAHPEGDPELAAHYMRRAGYRSGRYTGDARPEMVTDTTPQGRRFAEILRQALASIGIETDLAVVSAETMYSAYCNVPAKGVGVCPNVGWVSEFGDGQTALDVPFNGDAILPVNNSNWPQLNVLRINRAVNAGKPIHGTKARAAWWGRVDRMITAQAPAVPIVWRDIALLSSSDVNLVVDRKAVVPALSMTSLKGG